MSRWDGAADPRLVVAYSAHREITRSWEQGDRAHDSLRGTRARASEARRSPPGFAGECANEVDPGVVGSPDPIHFSLDILLKKT